MLRSRTGVESLIFSSWGTCRCGWLLSDDTICSVGGRSNGGTEKRDTGDRMKGA